MPISQTSDRQDVVVVIGTRPEAIKLTGLVQRLGPAATVVHTGQHYDAQMWNSVVDELPRVGISHRIHIGGTTRGAQIGAGVQALSAYLIDHPPRAVVVQGDTNSTLAGALAASACHVPVVHVEAGLRSHERDMPEEINRLLVDTVADLCCAPVAANAAQLAREGVAPERICVTGNTLADALGQLLPPPEERRRHLKALDLTENEYVLATVHRAGNVDDPTRLADLARGLARLAEKTRVILPVHPHTRLRLEHAGLLDDLGAVQIIQPLGPRPFLALESAAQLLVSDSGGVQEEACLLRRPLLVLRDSTERPELLDGWCRLLGDEDPGDAILAAWADGDEWARTLVDRDLPYPAVPASQRIAEEIDRRWPATG